MNVQNVNYSNNLYIVKGKCEWGGGLEMIHKNIIFSVIQVHLIVRWC